MTSASKSLLRNAVCLSLLITWTLFSCSSRAEHSGGSTTAGDGGHVVSCPGEKPVLLDYYEAKVLLGRDFDRQFEKGFSSEELMARVARLGGIDDRSFAETIAHVYGRMSPRPLPAKNLPSSYSPKPFVSVPADCQVEALGFRVRTPDPYFLVSREAWLKLDGRQRKLLRLHESLHDWFGGFGGSRAVRQAVIMILASDFWLHTHRPEADDLLDRRFEINWSLID